MFCDRCGTKLAPNATTCTSCGKSFVPLMPPARGIAGHVRLLGILWLAYGAMQVFPGLFMMVFVGRRFMPPDAPPFVFNFMPLIGGMLLLGGLAACLAGVGLLMRVGWARMTAIVLAALSLMGIPFGTALGIYTLWALLPAEHEQEYRALSKVA